MCVIKKNHIPLVLLIDITLNTKENANEGKEGRELNNSNSGRYVDDR